MQLVDTAEMAQLRATLRDVLREYVATRGRLRSTAGAAEPDTELWQLIVDELDLAGLLVPERLGGSGATPADAAVVLEELGRGLARVPYLASAVLAVTAIVATGDESAMAELLPDIAAGRRIAALAVAESDGEWSPHAIELRARPSGRSWRLTGTKSHVIGGVESDLLLVAGRTTAGLALFAVDADVAGLQRTALTTMDLTRPLARLDLDDVPGRLVGAPGGAEAVLAHVLAISSIALSAEQLGGMQYALEISVKYAKDRVQFGVPIGTFQAVKHRCADMLVAVETARALVAYAAWCASVDDTDLPVAAAMAHAYCSDAFFNVACSAIQLHGGIGFTWEHDAHLYLKRATTSRALLGTPTARRATIADLLGL